MAANGASSDQRITPLDAANPPSSTVMMAGAARMLTSSTLRNSAKSCLRWKAARAMAATSA